MEGESTSGLWWAVVIMTQVEYLISQRMTEAERLTFRQKYGLDNGPHKCQHGGISPEEIYQAHSHIPQATGASEH